MYKQPVYFTVCGIWCAFTLR